MVFPDGTEYDSVSSNFVNPLTACGFVDIAKKNGHKAIVHAAACSSLGKMLVRLTKSMGIPLINIVRREEQVKQLEELGAENIINSSLDTYGADLKAIAAKLEATVFFDPLGGSKATDTAISALPNGSTTYVYGGLGGAPIILMGPTLIFQQKTVSFFWLGIWFKSLTADERKEWSKVVVDDLSKKGMVFNIFSRYANLFPLSVNLIDLCIFKK